MVKKGTGPALDQLLCERVEAVVAKYTGGSFARERVLTALREVLDSGTLSREEEALRERKRAEGLRGQELLNCLIGARVERALHVALEAAVGSAEPTHLAELPRIVVLRGEVDLTGLDIPDADPNANTGERARETLILTDRAGLDQLTSAPTLTVQAVQVFGDEDEDESAGAGPTVTLPSGAEAAAHSAELRDLAATLSVHMGERPSGAPPLLPGSRADWTGRTLAGKYEIVKLLGRGGFGAVYQARDRVLGTGVAIKVLNPGASRSSADLEAFKNEARRVTRLDHPNIVGWKVFDELEDGTLYFVMELIQGEELEDTLEREKVLAPRRVARLLLQIVDALRAAHHISESESILHLDLKPRNVFLIKGASERGTDERAKVIDFGIGQYLDRLAPLPAPALEPEPETARAEVAPHETDSATANTPRARSGSSASSYLSGSEVGGTMVSVRHAALARAVDQERTTHVTRCNACTPEYASPEQCEHMDPTAQIRELDGRSDLYSLGVMGFRMLTGELPFKRPKKRRRWIELQRFEPPRRVRDVNPRVPKALARFIDRCLEKDRDARPDSNAAYEALYEIVHPKAKTLQTVAVVVLIGALIGAIAWFNRERAVLSVVARHVDGAEAVSEPVYLGPAAGRGELVLKIPDPEGRFDSPGVELVDAEGASLAPWLAASWAGDDTLRLAATERLAGETGRLPLAGRLVLREGDRRAESQELRCVYLGREWLSVFSVGVPGLGDDDLDPRRQQLRIELRCAEPEGLVVRALSGEHDLRVVPYTQSSEAPPEGHVIFGALLDDLAKLQTAGPVQAVVEVEVLDAAGNVFRPVRPFATRIDARDLALVSLTMQDAGPDAAAITPVNRRYLLYPETRPRLELVTNRTAEVEIALFAEGAERPLESTIRVGAAQDGEAGGEARVGFDFAPSQHLASGQKTLSGEVRVLVRDRGILRERPQEVRPPRDVLFTFTEEKAGFRVRLAGRDAQELRTGERGPLEIEVTRLGGVTSEVRLAGTGPDGALVRAAHELDLANPIRTFLLPIEREGVYELELSAYRSEGGEVGTQADQTEHVRVVVDRTPPALVLGAGLAAGPRVLANGRAAEPLELSLGPAGLEEEPVRLVWTLDGTQLADPAAHGLPDALGAAPVALRLPSGSDGRHTLDVQAVDAAGNVAELGEPLEWTVALAPPALASWIAPKQGRWSSDDAGVFHVEVELSDPNGIGAVTGRVVPLDGAQLAEELAFAPDAARPGVWTAATSLSPEWSHKEVEIQVVASDGTAAELVNDPPFTRERSLGLVVIAYPARVARVQGDRTPMRLITSNRELAYEFKGREDAVENEAFAKSGLPAYSERNERRSWKLDYPPGTIQDFYLDEREVTNAQYRAFQRATGHPGPAYLSEGTYAFSADEEPVVLVTWEEAAAYAAWVGKRLPSYVEWEYAVRGGPLRYRLYSTWTPERATPPEEIVAAPGWSAVIEASFSKHAAGSSSDVTPEGVHDLCGNVAEWTATPLFFGELRPANLMAHARQQKQGYLQPWTLPGSDRQPEYWIVGGAFDLPGAHFARTDQRPREARLANTGFRCAQDADSVLGGMEPKGSEYVEVRP